MRKLMWVALGFGAACAAGAVFDIPFIPLCLCFLTAAAGFASLVRFVELCRIGVLLSLGCALGLAWCGIFAGFYLEPPRLAEGQTLNMTAEISDFSYETNYGIAADAVVQLEGKNYQIRLYINEDLSLAPGDRVSGKFRIRFTAPDAEEPTYHSGKGIFLLAYQAGDIQVTEPAEVPLRYYPAVLRSRLIDIINTTFPADTAPFARALLLGDRTDMDYETDTAFKVSGISHIIAVSGLHVSILFSLIYFVTGKRRFLTVLLGIPLVLLFAAVAGFTPSVTRACLMHILMMIALLFDREYDGPTALSFAALVMLIANPLVITSVSFQLSVGCMAGIFLFNMPIKTWLDAHLPDRKNKLLHYAKSAFTSSVSVSLSAISITTPLVAYHFGTVSLVGALTNLFTLWMVTFVFYGIMAVCLAAAVGVTFANVLAGIVSWGARYVLGVSEAMASLPLAAVYTKSVYVVLWLAFVYILLAVFLRIKEKQPVILTCCAAMGLCLALLASWVEPLLDDCRMTVLDVGQGQCILLQSKGRTYMVDCGGDYDADTADIAAETLLSQGITKLDGLILTHYDRDHTGGAAYLLTRIDADAIFLPDSEDENGVAAGIREETEADFCYVSEDIKLSFGGAELTIFAPLPGQTGNESSMCILFQAGNCDILITGDRDSFGERMLLRRAEIPDLEVLVAGHHGSKYSTCEELLQSTMPDLVMISAGEGNPFGHPAQETLERLEDLGCRIYRTDTMGTIIFRR